MIATKEIEVVKKLIEEANFSQAEILLNEMKIVENNAEIQKLLGVIAFQTNRYKEAVDYFTRAVELQSDDGYLQHNLGLTYKVLGSIEKAKVAFKRAAKYQLDFADPLNQLGLIFKREGLIVHAEKVFLQAIRRNHHYPEAHYNLAVLLEELGRVSEAQKHYELALIGKPDYIQAINNLGTILAESGDYEDAEKLYREGIIISPTTPELHCSLGLCLSLQGRYSEAVGQFHTAVKLAPNFVENRWNLGFLQLAMGELGEGWGNYRYRHTVDRKKLSLPKERLPLILKGKTLHVSAEQGLGDQIFFSRFFPELRKRGAPIKFQPDPKIKCLFRRVRGIVVADNIEPDFSIADLPYLTGSSEVIASISLEPKEQVRTKILNKLADCGPPPYIGITYQAGGVHSSTLFKRAPTRQIGLVLREISATIISVQRNPRLDELTEVELSAERDVFDFSSLNENLEEALALMAILDDYIGVSNTNMHLRAAVGKPAKVLVTHPGEFRWQVIGNISPWFPNFKLYRQDADSDWEQAFVELKLDLRDQYG